MGDAGERTEQLRGLSGSTEGQEMGERHAAAGKGGGDVDYELADLLDGEVGPAVIPVARRHAVLLQNKATGGLVAVVRRESPDADLAALLPPEPL